MVGTRSGLQIAAPACTIKRKKIKKPVFVLKYMLREHGGSDPHNCSICRKKFKLCQDWGRDWLQCPECKDIVHAACFYKWCQISDNPTCPNCRTNVPITYDSVTNTLCDDQVEKTWRNVQLLKEPKEPKKPKKLKCADLSVVI